MQDLLSKCGHLPRSGTSPPHRDSGEGGIITWGRQVQILIFELMVLAHTPAAIEYEIFAAKIT